VPEAAGQVFLWNTADGWSN